MEEFRKPELLTRWIRFAAILILISPIVAFAVGERDWDILRIVVLAASACILFALFANIYDVTWRLHNLNYPSESLKENDAGRRDRSVFFVCTIGVETYRVTERLGQPHLNPQTPFLILLLWLALSVLLKIDVKRWRALP